MILKHWKAIGLIVVIAAVYISFITVLSQRDIARSELVEFKRAVTDAETKQRIENAKLKSASQKQQVDTAIAYNEHLNKVRDYYEKDRQIKSDTIGILDNRMRVEADNYRSRMSAILKSTELSTEIGGDCDTTLAGRNQYITVIKEACAVTTLDYNTLHDAWINECKIRGCD